MNCLILKHEQEAKLRMLELTEDIEEFKRLEKRLLKINEIFNNRHNEYYPSWDVVENCKCK